MSCDYKTQYFESHDVFCSMKVSLVVTLLKYKLYVYLKLCQAHISECYELRSLPNWFSPYGRPERLYWV